MCPTESDGSGESDLKSPAPQREPEYQGSIWKHPYMVYIYLTALLFGLLVVAGFLAVRNDWIPTR